MLANVFGVEINCRVERIIKNFRSEDLDFFALAIVIAVNARSF